MTGATPTSDPTPWRGRRLHFVGVGGAGMSGYARAAHALGAEVTGSDRASSPFLERLVADGVLQASVGQAAENVPPGEDVELVYSTAIPASNPERVAARDRGLVEHSRAVLLAQLSALRRTIAVAGAAGKTTTASMIVHALRGAELRPGWLIGAPVGAGLPNAYWSDGEWLVVEADESDRSMLSLHVEIAVLTNIALDHHDTYGSMAELREAFRAFLAGAPQAVVWNRPELLALRDGPVVAYDADRAQLGGGGSRLPWRGHELVLGVPGAHNASNAVAALEAARLAGADEELAVEALAAFAGAGRRFERLGHHVSGALVVDDYAHHPDKVAATLRGARTLGAERVVVTFQPHLFSRTRALAREFGEALALADVILVTDVYPARENAADYPGVSGLTIAATAADAAHGRPVYWAPSFADAQAVLDRVLRAGDVCLVMGAGDVDALGRALVAPSGGS